MGAHVFMKFFNFYTGSLYKKRRLPMRVHDRYAGNVFINNLRQNSGQKQSFEWIEENLARKEEQN